MPAAMETAFYDGVSDFTIKDNCRSEGQMKIGSWAEWAAAIFTGGAIFTALYQIRNERNVRLAEQKADTEIKKRYQAELGTTWSHGGYYSIRHGIFRDSTDAWRMTSD